MLNLRWSRKRFVLDLIERYDLFDADWYCASHPGLGLTPANAYRHFQAKGLKAGLSPTPLFQPQTYLACNPDVAGARVPALFHYLRHGGPEQRGGAHPLLSPDWIGRQVDLAAQDHENPILALAAAKSWVNPHPLIDTQYLAAQIGSETLTTWDVLRHYFGQGMPDTLDPHHLFDPALARASLQVPDGTSALEAFIRQDDSNDIRVHPLIDQKQIAFSTPLPEGMSYLEKIIRTGRAFRGGMGPLFDTEYYLSQAGAEVPTECTALEHFLSGGWRAGYWPNRWFDPVAYARRNLADAPDTNPLIHYALNGRALDIDLAPQFSQIYYVSHYPEVLSDSDYTPLEHYIRHGQAENRQIHPPRAWADDFYAWSKIEDAVRSGYSGVLAEGIEVSVIVPVFDQFSYTLRCLWSILQAGDRARVEVIVADDGSSDDTQGFFEELRGLRYVRNPENLGFLRSCNRAAGLARAPVLYFLNNDTAVLPGWIDTVLATLETHPEAGLVGSKLIYPDGRLQEAGGYIWRSGGGANAGRGGDPAEPGFNYLRDVDYVSGAGIAVRRTAWEAAGGFDDRYAPAYCEDSDLAMALRQHGWRVLYQPRSEVVHFEGVTSGTDTGAGIKAYQRINFDKLRDKWAYALERHAESHAPDPRALVRPLRPRLCVIDATVPTPDKDAGSVIAMWHLRILRDLGYDVTFLPENLYLDGAYGRALQAIGIEVLHTPYVRSVEHYLRDHGACVDLFLLARVDAGGRFNALIRALYPATPVIFNTVDLHYLRQQRQARLQGDAAAMAQANDTKQRELALIRNTSATIVVSEHEREMLARDEGLGAQLAVIPLVLEARDPGAVPGREGREGIAFVGGYQHPPNVDAVLWFCAEIWPLLRAAQPDLTFHVAGSKAPPEIADLRVEGVVVHGFVADLEGFLDARIATVAPLRYGAGIKGKVGSSLAAGVPCIASGIAAEGMGLVDGENILIADAPQDFAEAVLGLIRDKSAWQSLSRAGLDFVEASYSPAVTREHLLRLLARVGAPPFAGTCPISGARETRRLRDAARPDSLAADQAGPWSSERVLAQAVLERLGPGVSALNRLDPDATTPRIALTGRLPALTAALRDKGLLADPGTATLHAARLVLDESAADTLAALLRTADTDSATELLIACTTLGSDPIPPETLAPRIKQILATNTWTPRTTQTPTPETALTKITLIEARKITADQDSVRI